MAHNPHPHGERVVQPHKLHDHLEHQQNGGKVGLNSVAKLPDSHREDHEAHPYPNTMNPEPSTAEKID